MSKILKRFHHFVIFFSHSNKAYPESLRNYVIENYFELLKSCSAQPFSAEMTVLVCEPIIQAVAYCENKAFFKQSSEALIQGLLPGADDDVNSDEEGFSGEEELEESDEEIIESENESDIESISANSGEEVEFDSEDFDNIKDHCHDSECCHDHDHSDEDEDESFIFDYSLLSKFIFDLGAREDVLVRNRRFLYELSQIIEEVATGTFESCCDKDGSCCDENDSCCDENDSCCS